MRYIYIFFFIIFKGSVEQKNAIPSIPLTHKRRCKEGELKNCSNLKGVIEKKKSFGAITRHCVNRFKTDRNKINRRKAKAFQI
jgi:hypothetical protein